MEAIGLLPEPAHTPVLFPLFLESMEAHVNGEGLEVNNTTTEQPALFV